MKFLDATFDQSTALDWFYDPLLVTLSLLIAVFAAYAAFGFSERIGAATKTGDKLGWTALGALAMGVGIWATYFIAMLAFNLSIQVSYYIPTTLLSVVPAIIGSGVALYVVNQKKVTRSEIVIGGFLMGGGIAVMHYSGVAAMRMNAVMRFDLSMVIVSVAVAVALAVIALALKARAVRVGKASPTHWMVLLSALVMGLAVSATHYTGMAATYFFPGDKTQSTMETLSRLHMGLLVGLATVFVIILLFSATVVGRRLNMVTALENEIAQRQRAEMAAEERAEDLKRSDTIKRIILEGAPVGIVLYDIDGTILEANEDIANRNKSTTDEMIGKNFCDIYSPEIAIQRQLIIEQVIETRKTVTSEIERDGAVFEVLSRPHFDDSGKVIQISSFSHDITERKQLEARFAETQKMEALGKLTGGVAHEFNNMLMAVTGNLEVLLDKLEGSEELTRLASNSRNAARRGGELTHQLLSYTGRQRVLPKITDVNAFLSDAVDLLRPSLGEEIEFETVFADDLWPVKIDQSQLQQVMLNLAVNARDAMPDGGKITVEASNVHVSAKYVELHHPHMSAGDYVRISVTDTGAGMPPEVIEKAFDPFFTTKNMAEGTGLGLSMVYGFIHRQADGYVDIDSVVGIGTTVNLYLPRLEAAEEKPVETKNGQATLAKGKGTILVIEDDATVREVICDEALTSLGYTTRCVEDGPAALASLERSGPVDLMLIDIVLPGGMNGIELAWRVKETSPATRMIFMTGYSDEEVEARGLTGNGVSILRKPFKIKELAQVVTDAFEGAVI